MNVLYPIFTLVALTLAVVFRLAYLRYNAVASRKIDMAFYQAYIGDEPPELRITSRHLLNLLELPLLFYLACLIAYISGQSGTTVIALAWSYVGLRVIHTYIHLGSNVVIWRFRVFALSVLVLAVLWFVLFLGLVTH